MHFDSKGFFKKWSVAVLVPWLAAGCASVAPGLHFDSRSQNSSSGANGPNSAAADQEAANAVLKPITPQLVKQERESREKQVTQDISKLLVKPAFSS